MARTRQNFSTSGPRSSAGCRPPMGRYCLHRSKVATGPWNTWLLAVGMFGAVKRRRVRLRCQGDFILVVKARGERDYTKMAKCSPLQQLVNSGDQTGNDGSTESSGRNTQRTVFHREPRSSSNLSKQAPVGGGGWCVWVRCDATRLYLCRLRAAVTHFHLKKKIYIYVFKRSVCSANKFRI